MFAVCISYNGAQPRRNQGSASASSSQNNTDGATPRQSKHGRRQTRGAGSNQDRRQTQHDAERPVEHMNHAESWNGYRNLQTAVVQPQSISSGQKKKVKPSKDNASTSVMSSSPAVPSSQSPTVLQPASRNQPLSQSMSLCLYKVVVII